MKWVVLGDTYIKERYELLNSFICDHIEEAKVEFVSCQLDELSERLGEFKKEYDQIRLERPIREKILPLLEEQTAVVKSIWSADVLVQSHAKWWPRSTLFEALGRLAAHRFAGIDLTLSVLVVGTGASARAAIAGFTKMGFSEINVTDHLAERGRQIVEDIKKNYFGVSIRFTPMDELTLLAGNHQIVFNTTPYVSENQLLNELYYFNYLSKTGIVMDMTLVPVTPPLLGEAKSIDAKAVEGCELIAWSDVIWCEMCFGKKIDFKSYHESLRKKLKELTSKEEK